MERNSVVVGVDGSPGSAQALRWAADLARRNGWTVEAVLGWNLLDQHHPDGEDRFDPQYDLAAAEVALDAYVEQALGADATGVLRRAVLDLPASALLEVAEGSALLVVGARGLGGFKRLLLGSVSEHCLHHATGPVAVVHEASTAAAPGRILVGIDGSDNSVAALEWAADRAVAAGATLELVHAWHPPYVGAEPFAFSPYSWDDCEKAGRLTIDAAVARAGIGHLDIVPKVTMVEGSAAHGLVEASAEASMVVVGARGLGGFAGLLLGSVSTQVVRHAHCPVVVIPGGER